MPQWLKGWRSRNTPETQAGQTLGGATDASTVVDLDRYPGMDALLDVGDMRAVRSLLEQVEASAAPEYRARVELQLRHEAFRRAAARSSSATWPPTTDSSLSGYLPEIDASQLDVDILIAGVRTHGALLVRGLFADQTCAELRGMIDAAMAAHAESPSGGDSRFNTPLCNVSGEPLSPEFRRVNFDDGGRPTADCPAAAATVLAEFERIGIPDLVAGYLGEQPALSLEKWTLRRVPPDANSSWHQDGAFLGEEKHTVNMWVALSECGERASGLDIVARRFDHIVPTGTEGAYFYWDVAPDVVEAERCENPVVSPVFSPGDAVFFDQFLLHRTGIKPDLSEDRYALESWFFTPSSFPSHYEGLLL